MKANVLRFTLPFLFFLLGSGGAWATNFYVNQSTGNDSYNGSAPLNIGGSNGPKATLAAAVSAASGGDVIYIAAGIYGAATLDKTLTLRGPNAYAANNPNTGFRNAEAIIDGLTTVSGTITVEIDGFTLQSATGGLFTHTLNQNPVIRLRRNIMTCSGGLNGGGIALSGVSRLEFTENKVQNFTGNDFTAIQIVSSTNIFIQNNVFTNIDFAFVQLDAVNEAEISNNTMTTCRRQGINLQDASNVLIAYNLISAANTDNLGKAALRIANSGVNNLTVVNNTIQNSFIGLLVDNAVGALGANIRVNYNKFLGNSVGAIVHDGASGTLDATCNWYGSNGAGANYGRPNYPSGTNPGNDGLGGANVALITSSPWNLLDVVTTISGPANACASSSTNYTVPSGFTTYTWSVTTGGTITSGAGTNAVTVQWDGTSGARTLSVQLGGATCGGQAQTTVTVSPPPSSAPAIQGPFPAASPTICQGQTYTYYITAPTNATGYVWSAPAGSSSTGNGTLSIQLTAGGTSGNVTVTPTNGCGNGSAASLATSVTPIPTASDVTICPGQTATLTATATGTIRWYDSGNVNVGTGANFLTPALSSSAVYYVEVTPASGCTTARKAVNVTVQACTSGWTLSTLCEPITQDFNTIGSTAAATLPTGWRVSSVANDIIYANGASVTTNAGGTTGTGVLTSSSVGGCYNFANGANATSTDRAVGFLTSGSYAQSRSIMLELRNNTGAIITNLTVNFEIEKYRSGTRSFDFDFYHGSDGANWTNYTPGDQSFAPGDATNSTVYNPPTTYYKSVSLASLSIPIGGAYYLRWEYNSGVGNPSTNAMGIGLDNVEITAGSCGSELNVKDGASNVACGGTINFGSVNVGNTFTKNITIENQSVATIPLIVDAANLSVSAIDNGYDFAITPALPLSINPGATATLTIQLIPNSSGTKTGTLTLINNDSNESPCVLNFTGVGVATTPKVEIVSPGDGAAFYSSYVTRIKWLESNLTGSTPLQILYAEDGVNFIQVGTAPKAQKYFDWRPNFFQTTIDANGALFNNAKLRVKDPDTGQQDDLSSLTVSMRPCKANTVNQTITAQNFDSQTSWNYATTNIQADALGSVRATLNYGTIASGYAVNRTSGGANAFIKTDGACPCKTSGNAMSASQIVFSPTDVSDYANVQLTLYLASLEMTDNPCNAGGLCTGSPAAGNGADVSDYVQVFITLDGGAEQQVLQYNGFSDMRFKYDEGTPTFVLASGGQYALTTLSGGAKSSKLSIAIPDGTQTVEFRVVMANNRRTEVWALDDISLVGDELFTGAFTFSRDCMLDPSTELVGNTYTGNLSLTVADVNNEDTDVLFLDNTVIQGNLTFANNCIWHGRIGTQFSLQPGATVTVPAGSAYAFAAFPFLATYDDNTPYGLIQEVGAVEKLFPVGSYIDNNASCVKYYNPAALTNFSGNIQMAARVATGTPTNYRLSTDAVLNATMENQTVDCTWFIKSLSGSPNTAMKLYWYPGQEKAGFSRNLSLIDHGFGDGVWAEETSGATRNVGSTPYWAGASNILGFSPFKVESILVPLGVHWLDFTAAFQSQTTVRLGWETASENNSDYFAVERSLDGKTFDEIGRVKAAGFSASPTTYPFFDRNLPSQNDVFYYRLRQIDRDGSVNYSKIVEVKRALFNVAPNNLTLYPNPANETVTLSVPTSARVEWFDATGRSLALPAVSEGVYDCSALTAGVYFVRVTEDKDNLRQIRQGKFIKR